jgi:hypothetical protein
MVADVDAAVMQRLAVVQHVDIGRRAPGDARERGVDLVLARRGTGPPHDAELAGRAGMQCKLARRPLDAQPFDGLGGGIVRDVGIGAEVRAPELQAGQFGRLGGAAAMQVPAPAVEHDHPRVVQFAQPRQRGRGVAEHRPVGRLVQQPPDHDAGMVAVAANHAEQRLVKTLGHLRRRLQAPRRVGLLVDQQPDLVAQVELIPGRHAGDEPDRIEPHHLDVQQIAPQHVGVRRQLQTDRTMVARVRAAQKQPPAVQAKVAVFEREVAEAAPDGVLVEREAFLPSDTRAVTRYRFGSFNSHSRGWATCSSVSTSVSPGGRLRSRTIRSSVSPLAAGATENSNCAAASRCPALCTRACTRIFPSSCPAGRTGRRCGWMARRAVPPSRRSRRGYRKPRLDTG